MMSDPPAESHEDLLTGPGDRYQAPRIEGYPEQGDDVTVKYKSKRSGDIVEAHGEVLDVRDEGRVSGTTHPSYLLFEFHDDRRDRDVYVYGGGSYDTDDADNDSHAVPAQVWTETFADQGGATRSRRRTRLGRLVAIEAGESATFRVTVSGVPAHRGINRYSRDADWNHYADRWADAIEDAIRDVHTRDRTAQKLLDVDVERVTEVDR